MIKTWQGNQGARDADGEFIQGIIARKTIKSQAQSVTAAAKIPSSALDKRVAVLIFNNSADGSVLYIGASDVTTSNGMPLYPRASVRIDIEDDIDVYGVSDGTALIRVLETA